MNILIASNNAKKAKELQAILDGLSLHEPITVVTPAQTTPYPEPVEDGATFAENALIKARAGMEATGLATIADDSGFCVDALNGMPGVLSARWCGRHGDDQANNDLLLQQLASVPEDRRGAQFVCACALVSPQGLEVTVLGQWPGRVLSEPRGLNGFGYDPLFQPDGYDCSSAELAPEEKNAVSHRALALQQLVPHLEELLR